MTPANTLPMSLLFRLGPQSGHQSIFQPGHQGIRWLGLDIVRLPQKETWQGGLGEEEAVFVILSGSCAISVEGKEHVRWQSLGEREDVFIAPGTAVYVPRRSKVEVTAEQKLELAIIRAPCEVTLPPALVSPSDVKVTSVGTVNWQRDVRLIIPPNSPISQRLIVGETLNPPANWSGIPPHKHDVSNASENMLEELYLFKTKPTDGYAVQLTYCNGERKAHIVGHDHVMVFLRGYHPTVAPPGVTIYYLWALSGQSKDYKVTADSRFACVSSMETTIKQNGAHPEAA